MQGIYLIVFEVFIIVLYGIFVRTSITDTYLSTYISAIASGFYFLLGKNSLFFSIQCYLFQVQNVWLVGTFQHALCVGYLSTIKYLIRNVLAKLFWWIQFNQQLHIHSCCDSAWGNFVYYYYFLWIYWTDQ